MAIFNLLAWKKSEFLLVAGICLVILGISRYQIIIGEMKTRDSQRMQDLSLMKLALRTYFNDYQEYPMEATGEGKILSCGEKGQVGCNWGGSTFVDQFNVTYLNKVPRDPQGDVGKTYVYKVSPDRQHFKLFTALEFAGTTKLKSNLTTECGLRVQCNWYEEN
jgi:hypothetical protein